MKLLCVCLLALFAMANARPQMDKLSDIAGKLGDEMDKFKDMAEVMSNALDTSVDADDVADFLKENSGKVEMAVLEATKGMTSEEVRDLKDGIVEGLEQLEQHPQLFAALMEHIDDDDLLEDISLPDAERKKLVEGVKKLRGGRSHGRDQGADDGGLRGDEDNDDLMDAAEDGMRKLMEDGVDPDDMTDKDIEDLMSAYKDFAKREMEKDGGSKSGKGQSGKGQSGKSQSGRGQSGKDQSGKSQSDRGQSDKGQSDKSQSGRRQNGKSKRGRGQRGDDGDDLSMGGPMSLDMDGAGGLRDDEDDDDLMDAAEDGMRKLMEDGVDPDDMTDKDIEDLMSAYKDFAKREMEKDGRGKSGKGQSGRGQSDRGQSDKGQSGKDQSGKGQSNRGQSGRGQSDKVQSGKSQSGRGQSGKSKRGRGQRGDDGGDQSMGSPMSLDMDGAAGLRGDEDDDEPMDAAEDGMRKLMEDGVDPDDMTDKDVEDLMSAYKDFAKRGMRKSKGKGKKSGGQGQGQQSGGQGNGKKSGGKSQGQQSGGESQGQQSGGKGQGQQPGGKDQGQQSGGKGQGQQSGGKGQGQQSGGKGQDQQSGGQDKNQRPARGMNGDGQRQEPDKSKSGLANVNIMEFDDDDLQQIADAVSAYLGYPVTAEEVAAFIGENGDLVDEILVQAVTELDLDEFIVFEELMEKPDLITHMLDELEKMDLLD